MVLVSSLWRDSALPSPVSKRIVQPRVSDHVLPAAPFVLPTPPGLPSAACLPRVLPPSREGRLARVEDEARVINRRERVRFHGGQLPTTPRQAHPIAADMSCEAYATLALRSGRPIFPSQPEMEAAPNLGPIQTTTLVKSKPAPPIPATPRSLQDPVLRKQISTPRQRSPAQSSARSPRSSRPSTRERPFSDRDSLLSELSSRGRDRSRSPPAPAYFHDMAHTGFETLSARRNRGRHEDRDRDFDDAMLNPEKCVADINEFELANLRRARAFLL